MEVKQRLMYTVPKLTVYGRVETLTKAVAFPGSGDLWSQLIEDGGITPPGNGCDGLPSDLASQICTGS